MSIITFSKNIYENKNDTRNVTLVKGDGKEINAHRKLSLIIKKEVRSIITFSKNIYENENDTRNVTLVKGDGKEINAHRKLSLIIIIKKYCQ